MRKSVFLWACLPCFNYIQGAPPSKEQAQGNLIARHISTKVDQLFGSRQLFADVEANRAAKHLRALASIFLEFNPLLVPKGLTQVANLPVNSPSFAHSIDLGNMKTHGRHDLAAKKAPITMSDSPVGMIIEPSPPVYPELKTLLDAAVTHIRAHDEPALRALLLSPETEVTLLVGAVRTGRNGLSAPADAYERTLLHIAAASGDVGCVQVVLDALLAHERALGVGTAEIAAGLEMWGDKHNLRAGEYAYVAGSQEVFDLLIDAACARPLRSVRTATEGDGTGHEYLKRKLEYKDDVLYDSGGHGIMMGWEHPLMKAHAQEIMPQPGRGARVLNIGFGLGIVDGYIQERQPGHHVIVEAHPDVHAEMAKRGWTSREDVTVLKGRWQDVADQIEANGPYDGVFFDTWAEVGSDLIELFKLIPRCLKVGGRFSWFNGLSDGSLFTNAVQFRLQQMELARRGLVCSYRAIPFGGVGDEEWRKVSHVYWPGATYYLPIAIKTDMDTSEFAGGGGDEAAEAAQLGTLAFARMAPMVEAGTRTSAIQLGDEFPKVMEKKLLQAWWNDFSSGQDMLGLGEKRKVAEAFGRA